MSAPPRVLLITGASGKQGGAVIDALVSQHCRISKSTPFIIPGVTRNPISASAKAVAAKSPLIKLIKGDLNDCASIFRSAREVAKAPVFGVFSVQALGDTKIEEAHGKALIDEALKAGVHHFVYTSVDRSGNEKSWTNPTPVPHFASKHNIELHLRDKAVGTGMTWTILRPTGFMDSFAPGFQSRVFFAALNNHMDGKGSPFQLIAAKDIERFGATALLEEKIPAYRNQAIGLAAEEFATVQALVDVMKANTTNPITPTLGILGSAFVAAMHDLGSMVKWFGTDGYGVNIEECRRMQPHMLNTAEWLRTESTFDLKK